MTLRQRELMRQVCIIPLYPLSKMKGMVIIMASEIKETLFAEERKLKILEMIKNEKKVTVEQLCNTFNVSGATIRNDLREMEGSNLLTRTHGGALVKYKTGFELETRFKEGYHQSEKVRIAKEALNLIDDGDTILLDTGTTTLELAKLLAMKRKLTVLINDIQIASVLEDIDDISIFFIGGAIRKKLHCTIGVLGTKMLSELAVDKAFMAVNGISLSRGATTPDMNQAEMKKGMVSIANQVIILCDSSKVGISSFAQFADWNQIDTVITDEGIDNVFKKEIESRGTEVLIAK
jgi:DeoR family fructose operon transcriptional repressor